MARVTGGSKRRPASSSPRLFAIEQTQHTSDDMFTPPWLFEQLGITFDLDPCAPPGGVPWLPATCHYSRRDDGLAQEWHGRVWLNPPFSHAALWINRFIDHADGITLVQVAKAAYTRRLWATADAIALVPENVRFVLAAEVAVDDRYRQVFMPTWLAAYGPVCAEAVARVGVVRVVC